MSAILLGMTQIGLHVWDNARLLDYALGHEDCSEGRVACIGVSGGGQATLWLAPLDERVRVAVVSGHLGSFTCSILQTDGCSCTAGQDARWADSRPSSPPRWRRAPLGELLDLLDKVNHAHRAIVALAQLV